LLDRTSLLLDRTSLLLDRTSLSLDRTSLSLDCTSLFPDRTSLLLDCTSVSLDCTSVSLDCTSLSLDCTSLSLDCTSLLPDRTSLSPIALPFSPTALPFPRSHFPFPRPHFPFLGPQPHREGRRWCASINSSPCQEPGCTHARTAWYHATMDGWSLSSIGGPEPPNLALQIDEELLRIAGRSRGYPGIVQKLGDERDFPRMLRMGDDATNVVCDARRLRNRLIKLPAGAPPGHPGDAPKGSVWRAVLDSATRPR
jgi:hypothetical protein